MAKNFHLNQKKLHATHYALTARQAGLVMCHGCNCLSRWRPPANNSHAYCARCGAALHLRTPHSVETTSALLVAAMIFFLPANMLPVMSVYRLGSGQPDTILGGVLHLFEAGLWPLALLIFVASIVVPILKLLTLTLLVVSVQRGSIWRLRERTRLYRLAEYVGRWSMVDVFVIAILTALVQFGNLAHIEAGGGALSFAAVVILTMLAASSFDIRLIWDAIEENESKHDR